MKKIVIAFGTRPEVIKLAPVIQKVKELEIELKILHTGQHSDLADSMLKVFNIEPDANLNVMKENQNLFELSASILPKAGAYFEEEKPDFVMVQGDTTTAYLCALAAYYHKIPVMHVEAGLRSHNHYFPFPEEANRKLISQIAAFHFAPTLSNQENLLRSGISEENIHITGNTIIDALNHIQKHDSFLQMKPDILSEIPDKTQLIVMTTHRRENHGEPFQHILAAAKELISKHENRYLIFPAHPNPQIQNALKQYEFPARFTVTAPFDYLSFLHIIKKADLLLTDSGGIQEEATALGKPVVVLRNETERNELIESGLGKLVGSDKSLIIKESEAFLENPDELNPSQIFGDGNAAARIAKVIEKQL